MTLSTKGHEARQPGSLCSACGPRPSILTPFPSCSPIRSTSTRGQLSPSSRSVAGPTGQPLRSTKRSCGMAQNAARMPASVTPAQPWQSKQLCPPSASTASTLHPARSHFYHASVKREIVLWSLVGRVLKTHPAHGHSISWCSNHQQKQGLHWRQQGPGMPGTHLSVRMPCRRAMAIRQFL